MSAFPGGRPCGPARAVLGGAAALLLLAASAATAAEAVDLELVIATDTSGSINDYEAMLQRRGVAEAFRSTDLVQAIRFGSYGKIAAVYLDWSNQFDNRVVIDWRVIHDKASADRFADDLEAAPRTYGRRTSISSAIVSAMLLFETNNFQGTRRTIDVSGDGPNNFGLALAPVRDAAVAKGITINGLPIIVPGGPYERNFFPDIDQYYVHCVIGGRGAFAVVASGYEDFSRAVRRKLILEIAGLDPGTRLADSGEVMLAATIYDPGVPLTLPTPPGIMRAPAESEQDCDVAGWGFGGFGGFGR